MGCALVVMTKHADVSAPQSVTDFIKVQTSDECIKIGFTQQVIAPHAALSAFAGFWIRTDSDRSSPSSCRSGLVLNATASEDLASGFMVGILAGAKKTGAGGALGSAIVCSRVWLAFFVSGANLRIPDFLPD